MKLKGSKVTSVLNKLHLAQPAQRDDVVCLYLRFL